MASDKSTQIAATAHAISSEPLARIMFGGRELFHSNLIAWFCETMPVRATAVFDQLLDRDSPPVSDSCSVEVRREWKHLDLVIRWANDERDPVVIENKVFSLPDLVQLDGYADELRKHPALTACAAVLLSLSDPKFDDDVHLSKGKRKAERAVPWRRVSYGALGDAIADAVTSTGSDYATETLRHYANLARNLHAMADLLEVSEEQHELVHMDVVLAQASQDRQLITSLSKLRARNVVTHIVRTLPQTTLGRRFDSGFSNGSPLIEISYALTKTKRPTLLGWQLQGSQLRLTAVLPALAGRTPQSRAKREQWGAREPICIRLQRVRVGLRSRPSDLVPKEEALQQIRSRFHLPIRRRVGYHGLPASGTGANAAATD